MESKEFGQIIKSRRKALCITQADVSLSSGVGMRFISNLENGKATCEIGKAFNVLESLGLELKLNAR